MQGYNCMTDDNIELKEATKTSKARKTAGYDSINVELTKYARPIPYYGLL
jgi:hypothetical protein